MNAEPDHTHLIRALRLARDYVAGAVDAKTNDSRAKRVLDEIDDVLAGVPSFRIIAKRQEI